MENDKITYCAICRERINLDEDRYIAVSDNSGIVTQDVEFMHIGCSKSVRAIVEGIMDE